MSTHRALTRLIATSLMIGLGAPPAAALDVDRDKLAPAAVLVRDATVWTQGPDGRLEHADLLVQGGRVKAVGPGLSAPRGAHVIDGAGLHVTPGLVDCHSHTAIRGGVNEGSNNVTAEVRIKDVVEPGDVNLYRQLAGGLTAAHLLHGSANSIGGQDAVVKLRWRSTREGLIMKGAPEGIKFALGENPKRSNFNSPSMPARFPRTRMGVNLSIREAFLKARDYQRESREYDSLSASERRRNVPPRRDLQLEALVEILEGKRLVHSHSYRQDEILALIRLADELGFRIATFQHVLEGYKVADELAAHGAGASTFSDWWAYKLEAYDAIPHAGALMHRRGVLTSFNSDSSELARRLNLEAAKAVKYGGLGEEEALSFVTINAAEQLGIGDRIGSLEPGKDGDFVIWSGHPLSVYSIVEQTWVDGVREFDRQDDLALREVVERERAELVARIRGDDGDEEEDEGDEEEDEGGDDHQPLFESRLLDYSDRLAALGGAVSIVSATVHPVTSEAFDGGTVSFRDGRIVQVGQGLPPLPGARVIDGSGLHVYPGLIDANNVLGLTEIGSVSGSVDTSEMGELNPAVNTAIAVNPDSALIPVARSNGLTHALAVPGGGLVRGTSSLTRLDGWTWEDLRAASPVALHVSWPSFRIRTSSWRGSSPSREEQVKSREERLERIRGLFRDARAHAKARAAAEAGGERHDRDPGLEAMAPVLDREIPVVVHASQVRQVESAIEWAKEEGVRLVLAGAGDYWRVADRLRDEGVPVVLTSVLRLPSRPDEPYDTPYTEAAKLHAAGVRFCISGSGGASSARSLPWHAAMAVAFGLPHDVAIRALTLEPARILGVDHALGSIEVGKSASLMITDGDPLEIRTEVVGLFIDGREVDPKDNKHDRLYERYRRRPTLADRAPGG